MSRENESDDIDRIRLHKLADLMDGYQLRLTVSFIEELFEIKECGEEDAND